jgi:hypothetical protein
MSRIYRDISDCINNAVFECQVYGDFIERIPLYFRKYPDRLPIYSNPQGHSQTKLTIAQMVNRFSKGESFAIFKPSDVVLVLRHCRTYIDSVGGLTERIVSDKADESQVFLRNIKLFLAEIEECEGRANVAHRKAVGLPEREPVKASSILERLTKGISL